MPDSPLHRDAGNKAHALQMLEYFNSRFNYIELYFVSEKYWGQWTSEDIEEFKHIFPHLRLRVLSRKIDKRNKIKYFLEYKLPNAYKKNDWMVRMPALPNNNTIQLQKAFNVILKEVSFDYIIISYVTWATLIENNPYLGKAILINDTHDFITVQNKSKKNFRLGKSFEREMDILSLFDEVWSQSFDEQYLFSQFVSGKHRFVPIMYSPHYKQEEEFKNKQFDLIYVGSENPNNKKSLNWFFDKVYPLLSEELNICVIGKIGNYIPDFPNVQKIIFAKDLSDYYENSKIAICPMLSGTGVKVKVVEAMAYGLPIVCNLRGLDGLPSKENNGCLKGDTSEEFAKHINNLLTDKILYGDTQKQAIEMFQKYFEKGKAYKTLDQILNIGE